METSDKVSWEQNAEAHLKADTSFGGAVAKLLGVDVSVGGSVSAQNSSAQTDGKSNNILDETHTGDKQTTGTRTSHNESALESLGVDKTQQEGIREAHNETKRLEESMSAHKSNIDSYNKKIDYVESHNNEFNRDMTQEVIEGYKHKYNVGDNTAAKEVLSGSSKARGVFRELSSAKVMGVRGEIQDGGAKIATSSNIDTLKKDNEGQINTTPGEVSQKFAENNGMLDKTTVANQVESQRDNLKTGHEEQLTRSNEEYAANRADIAHKKGERQNTLERYDADRMGHSDLDNALGINIGRPAEYTKTEDYPTFTPIMKPYSSVEKENKTSTQSIMGQSNKK